MLMLLHVRLAPEASNQAARVCGRNLIAQRCFLSADKVTVIGRAEAPTKMLTPNFEGQQPANEVVSSALLSMA